MCAGAQTDNCEPAYGVGIERPTFRAVILAGEPKAARIAAAKVKFGKRCNPSSPLSSGPLHLHLLTQQDKLMNNIVWLVGAVVIVLAVLGFFGLR